MTEKDWELIRERINGKLKSKCNIGHELEVINDKPVRYIDLTLDKNKKLF
jgi:hypothetical protein